MRLTLDAWRVEEAPAGFAATPAPLCRRDAMPLFRRDRTRWRLACYAVLAAADALVILCAQLSAGTGLDRPFGLTLLLYAVFAVRLQGFGLLALRHPYEGAVRAAMAGAGAALATLALSLWLNNAAMLPPAFARTTIAAAAGLFVVRRLLGAWFGALAGGRHTNDLVLIDGERDRDFTVCPAVRATELGIAPVASDPAMLERIGGLLKHCDRVIVDTPLDRRERWLDTLRGIDVDVEFVAPELADRPPLELRAIEGRPTLLMRRGALGPAFRVQKRAFDVAVAAAALVVAAPVMLALAVALRREGAGPVFFRQLRVGRGNRLFSVIKFRTMRHNAADPAGAQSARRADDRVTPLGRFMRRTSLDELPQLFNVLAGNMSIVGPRPHALGSRAGDALFWEVDAGYWDRHAIKPGMTGLAQVRGLRGATDTGDDIARRLRADIEYIANWSLTGDLFILLRTLRVLVHDRAY